MASQLGLRCQIDGELSRIKYELGATYAYVKSTEQNAEIKEQGVCVSSHGDRS